MKKTIITIILLIIVTNIFSQNISFSDLRYDCTYCLDSTENNIIVDTIIFEFIFSYKNTEDVEKELHFLEFEYAYIGDTIIHVISFADISTKNNKIAIRDRGEAGQDIKRKWIGNYNVETKKFTIKKCIRFLNVPTIQEARFTVNYVPHMHKHVNFYLGKIDRELVLPLYSRKKVIFIYN